MGKRVRKISRRSCLYDFVFTFVSYLVIILSVESNDVKIEDSSLSHDYDDSSEAQETVVQHLSITHPVGGPRLVRTLWGAPIRCVHQVTVISD